MENAVEKNNTNDKIKLIKSSSDNIRNLIYTIRGKKVMLDSDVAMLYQYTTKNINKAMKRNLDRFPEDFCFELTEREMSNLRFQNGTSNLENNYGGRRYLPYVYTEQGISMLAGILKNEICSTSQYKHYESICRNAKIYTIKWTSF